MRRRAGIEPSGGFALPLAMGTALVLLLSGLSIQTTALQGQAVLVAASRSRQAEDDLASAAEQLVATLVQQHPCLLPLSLADWSESGLSCTDPASREHLIAATIDLPDQPAMGYRLLHWQPSADLAAEAPGSGERQLVQTLELELAGTGAGGTSPRAQFVVTLAQDTATEAWRVQRLHELGLRGTQR
ncbi:hypothetical protein VB716_13560 [Synechococcus sp. CCY9201]|uniref:hypothetical protein n=1 Tax=unclassified Synechococcus TaxID=2626047 RepID=UPI002AD43455|nr:MULTISPECIES: hypothetical protein [unclassified Synechococcus]MEA5475246.1 hypothetical protein [Synechococcus sp. CCY9201]